MSFGFSVGDFLAVGQLSWKVYKKCKDSPGSYVELSNEVGALHNVMKETEELFSQQDLTPQQKNRLLTCQQGCGDVLKDLDRVLVKYESLGTKTRRTFDRMGFGTQDMNDIRSRLNLNVSMLDAFNNASSHTRLENKLNLLIAEVRSGKREGSVISTQTFDTAARNDQETWEALIRELEDIGISPGVIAEKRHFIIAWFREAVAAGSLEEDAASDDSYSAISVHESEDRAGVRNDDRILSRELSSAEFELSATPRRAVPQSEPSTSRPLRRPADLSSSPPPQKKGKSRLRVAYLLPKKLREEKFFIATVHENVSKMKSLLEKGVNIQARTFLDPDRGTALHEASRHGDRKTVQFLLSSGADVYAKNKYGATALHRAAMSGSKRVVDALLKQDVDIDAKNSNGNTGLILASLYGHEDTVQLLLEQGADIDAKNSNGDTGLILAAHWGHQDTVQLLLEQGADIDAKNSNGVTALMGAAKHRKTQTAYRLLDKGARMNTRSTDGETALTLADKYASGDVAIALRDAGARR